MPKKPETPDVSIRTEYLLITEYAPGKFSVRTRGTEADVLAQHAGDEADGQVRLRQGVQLTEIISVAHPVKWLNATP